MNIPEKIKIGWQEYDVIEKEVDVSLVSGGNKCYGQIFCGERKIYINSAYDEDQRKATLLHEVLHGIDELWDLDLSEEKIKTLAHGIYTVIKDNPNLFG